MTREERLEHTRRICRRVTAVINEISPKGLGHWDTAWRMVDAPSGAFLDALDAWVKKDSTETREEVKLAARRLLMAWEDAASLSTRSESSKALETTGAI